MTKRERQIFRVAFQAEQTIKREAAMNGSHPFQHATAERIRTAVEDIMSTGTFTGPTSAQFRNACERQVKETIRNGC